MKPRLCKAGTDLRTWVNKHYPGRDKTSDGWIGDTAHQARPSDHNPDADAIVRAIDIDADLKPKAKDKTAAHRLAETLRLEAKTGTRPIAYIIWNGRISSPKRGWAWRPYEGLNPHNHHIHISFRKVEGE